MKHWHDVTIVSDKPLSEPRLALVYLHKYMHQSAIIILVENNINTTKTVQIHILIIAVIFISYKIENIAGCSRDSASDTNGAKICFMLSMLIAEHKMVKWDRVVRCSCNHPNQLPRIATNDPTGIILVLYSTGYAYVMS